ncbi:MAG: NAD(P)H-dependent oxidoreductase subunit E [Desulfobacterota bacterium]|nr:NAD(P)H-dependent oxidoreductase subunit E [Thermodesulfobacteriota bacterium]
MFETMLGEVPEAMRPVFRQKLMSVIMQKANSGDVTDAHVNAVVQEIVPEPFKSTILKKFKELGDFDINIIDEIIRKRGTTQDGLMSILHDIQDEIGYLPIEALRAVSSKCNIPLSTVYNIVTFYKTFKLKKPGQHTIKICNGTACALKDKAGIRTEVENRFKHSLAVDIEKTLCLGCCDCAPAIEIDGVVYTGDNVRTKIETLL